MIRAAGKPAPPVVDDASAAVGEGAVHHLVAQAAELDPAVDPILGHPDVVLHEAAGGNRVPKTDHALARDARIVPQVSRERGDGPERILRPHQERHHRAGRLRRDGRAVEAVAGHRVPGGAVVHHGNRNVSRGEVHRPVDPVKEGGDEAVRVVEPGRDHDRLIGRGNGRGMAHLVNGRPGIGDIAAVALSGRAQVGRHRQGAGYFQPVAAQAHQELGPAIEPAGFQAQRGGLA